MWVKAMEATNTPSRFALSVVRSGYRFEWAQRNQPPKQADIFRRERNHLSRVEHTEFVTQAIKEGVRAGTILVTSEENLICVMGLGVAIHSRTKKKRLNFDVRHLNQFLQKTKFKMESLDVEGGGPIRKLCGRRAVDISSAWARRLLTRSGDDGHAKAGAKTGEGSSFSEDSVINVFLFNLPFSEARTLSFMK